MISERRRIKLHAIIYLHKPSSMQESLPVVHVEEGVEAVESAAHARKILADVAQQKSSVDNPTILQIQLRDGEPENVSMGTRPTSH